MLYRLISSNASHHQHFLLLLFTHIFIKMTLTLTKAFAMCLNLCLTFVWIPLFPRQATLPDYQPIENYRSEDDEDRDLEDPRWTPGLYIDNDLLMYLTAARSISAFQGMCEEDGCMAASRDDTTINAFDVVSIDLFLIFFQQK